MTHATTQAAAAARPRPAYRPDRLRSVLFNLLFYALNTLVVVTSAWILLLPRRQMVAVMRALYQRPIAWLERHVLGLRWEVRNRERLPQGACLIAMKHMSTWETLKLHLLFDQPAVVLKRELLRIPFWGWYARKLDMMPIDRSSGAKALRGLVDGGRRMKAQGRPIVIFPQGTRVAPGRSGPYQVGLEMLYDRLDLPVVPVALNSGMFWGRLAFWKRGGTAVMEVLEPIPPGLPRREMATRLQEALEAASDRLVQEAGGPALPLAPTPRPVTSPAPSPAGTQA